jgi:hypothetical protein
LGYRSAIETRDRVDRQLAVEGLELLEIVAIARPIGKALEGNDAAQCGERSDLPSHLGRLGVVGEAFELRVIL